MWDALGAAVHAQHQRALPAARLPDPDGALVAALLRKAEAVQLDGLVADGLLARGVALPAGAAERARRRSLAQAVMLSTARAAVHDAFHAAGVPHVFLKGAVTDAAFLGGRGRRGVSDLDVLVPAAAEPEAHGALLALGYRRDLPPRHVATTLASKERCYLAAGQLAVDLHVRALNSPPFGDDTPGILARAADWETPDGTRIPGPGAEDLVVIAVGNLAGDRFLPRYKMAVDAWGALAHAADAAVVEQRCRALGLGWAWWALAELLAARWQLSLHAALPPPWARPVLAGLAGVHGAPWRTPDKGLGALLAGWPWTERPDGALRAALRWAALRARDAAAR